MKKTLFLTVLCLLSIGLHAQSIVLTSGSLEALQGEKIVKFEFTYDDMLVGKMTEQEYINKKISDYNKKEAGRGDKWHENWIGDRKGRFEPQFIELFHKYMEDYEIVVDDEGAKYLFVFNTDFTEPGFNVGVMRRNAAIDISGAIIDIATGEPIAKFKIKNASANNFMGTDFDTGFRIQETYGKAGREFAKFLAKKGKLKKS
ncbi:hypothetical protein [Bacteroides sp. 51]|uniref:hypothetical protein n=1 Tax=Bacteroides sp. 51 TaxID=2302938 RepID=UPI0013D2AB10|nr:hypothetical protein [Bacteroides sp. 51]NDV81873.1 hypothetical protein [Bacteroides sp. 51]